MSKFSVYAWPAYSTKKRNPYTYLIYKNIEEQGYPVHEFYLTRIKYIFKIAFSTKCKVFHLHWPHSNILKTNSAIAGWRRIIYFFIAIQMIKLSGKKIVWTVHELDDHENRLPRLRRHIDRMLYRKVDGFISMNQKLVDVIQKKVARGKKQQIAHISHPHYIGYYPNDINQCEARKKLGIAPESFVFLFIGQIRNYKNVPSLIQAFKALNDENATLLIAGWIKSDSLLATINDLIGDSKNIKFYGTFINDDDLQVFVNAADLVVTPYRRIYNSGSVFMNLSFSRPTLGPDMFAISELKDALGPQWVKTYQETLSAGDLQKAMQEVKQEKNSRQKPDLEAYSPKIIASQTVDFYKSLITA